MNKPFVVTRQLVETQTRVEVFLEPGHQMVGLLDSGRRLGTVFKPQDKLKLHRQKTMFANLYTDFRPGTELVEVICPQSGKTLMPPIPVQLQTSSTRLFLSVFTSLRFQLQSEYPINADMTDEEAFNVCFCPYERPEPFKILLVSDREEERTLGYRDEIGIDWQKVPKWFVLAVGAQKAFKNTYKKYAAVLCNAKS
jgi:hypothetical protein